MAVDNFQSLGGGGGGGAIKAGCVQWGRAPSCPQIGGLGSAVIGSSPNGNGVWGEAPAALTFSLFVVSKNLTLNAEIDPALYGIATNAIAIYFS